jgi:hypothetical protein
MTENPGPVPGPYENATAAYLWVLADDQGGGFLVAAVRYASAAEVPPSLQGTPCHATVMAVLQKGLDYVTVSAGQGDLGDAGKHTRSVVATLAHAVEAQSGARVLCAPTP